MRAALRIFARVAWAICSPRGLAESIVRSQVRSLRALVEKWLGSDSARPIRVARVGRSREMPWRHVRVETVRRSAPFEIVFFRHADGSWCVFPPEAKRPAMSSGHRMPPTGGNPHGI